MAGFERIATGSLFQKMISIVAVALFITPPAVNAESLLLLHNAGGNNQVAETVRPSVKAPVGICLDGNGDLVLRHSGVMLTLAHTPPDEIIERLRIAQRQDCPSLTGISLKFSFLF